jgi:hypothetical protein
MTRISQGSVSNITTEWKTDLGYPGPDDLRDLGIMLKNTGMTSPQCAMGLRIAQIMQSLGIDQDNFRTFISEIYKRRSAEIGLRLQKVAENVKQLLELSETFPLWQIPQYISDKTSEKRELEEDILGLRQQESQARRSFELALRTTNVSSKLLNDLEKTGILLDDIEPFVKAGTGRKKIWIRRKEVGNANVEFSGFVDEAC